MFCLVTNTDVLLMFLVLSRYVITTPASTVFKYYGVLTPDPEICPGLNANEIQIPYDKHHKVSSLVKSHQNTHNAVKYEVV